MHSVVETAMCCFDLPVHQLEAGLTPGAGYLALLGKDQTEIQMAFLISRIVFKGLTNPYFIGDDPGLLDDPRAVAGQFAMRDDAEVRSRLLREAQALDSRNRIVRASLLVLTPEPWMVR